MRNKYASYFTKNQPALMHGAVISTYSPATYMILAASNPDPTKAQISFTLYIIFMSTWWRNVLERTLCRVNLKMKQLFRSTFELSKIECFL